MTKLQEILQLQKLLPDRTGDIHEMKEACPDHQYDAHHAITVYASDTIGDYQVIRKYDVEIDPNMGWEYDLIDRLTEDEKKYVLDSDEEINDNFYETYNPEEYMYDYEIGEYMQIWYNVKDNSTYMLGRIFRKDPYYCDFDAPWVSLSEYSNKRKKKFLEHFGETDPYTGFYRDFSVHPDLVAVGYSGIDAFNFYYGCGDEEEFSLEAKFIMHKDLDKFFTELLLQESDEAKCIRLYGLDDCLFVLSIEDKDFQQEAIAALRICHRHNYKITDRELWRDMIEQLYKMDKDLHNPHYVCPANLKEAHDKVSATYRKNLQKIQEKQQIRQAAAQLKEFLQHMQAFMDLCFTNDHITIRPLRSPLEYIEEGKAMHHCVALYKDRYNSLILSARDADEKRLATIEVDLTSYRIVQIRGLQNAATPHHEEIAILLTKNMQYIRKANQQQKKLNAAQSA